jgi:hypothetical protein
MHFLIYKLLWIFHWIVCHLKYYNLLQSIPILSFIMHCVTSSTRWVQRPSPKSPTRQNLGLIQHPIWESGCLGHAKSIRGFPKYEVTKRLGHADMRGTPILRGTPVDERMGLFGRPGPHLGRKANFGVHTIYGGKRTCRRWRKRSMPKTEEKQCDTHADKPSHVRVRVFDMIVMAMSQ